LLKEARGKEFRLNFGAAALLTRNRAPPTQRRWSMIRKLETGLSEKIMLKQQPEARTELSRLNDPVAQW
jgi:hypothetical protein